MQRIWVSMLAGPLYALSIFLSDLSVRSELCSLECAGASGVRWVAPCFIARHNARTRTGNCSVTELRVVR
jgi:hypothetical protein